MKNTTISLIMKIAIALFAFCGVLFCAIWYPFTIALSSLGFPGNLSTFEQDIVCWIQIIFYWVASIPCFVILLLLLVVANKIKRDEIFTNQSAKLFKACAIILVADIAIFLIGNIILLLLDLNIFALIYIFISLIGIVAACFLWVCKIYISKAVLMKEKLLTLT